MPMALSLILLPCQFWMIIGYLSDDNVTHEMALNDSHITRNTENLYDDTPEERNSVAGKWNTAGSHRGRQRTRVDGISDNLCFQSIEANNKSLSIFEQALYGPIGILIGASLVTASNLMFRQDLSDEESCNIHRKDESTEIQSECQINSSEVPEVTESGENTQVDNPNTLSNESHSIPQPASQGGNPEVTLATALDRDEPDDYTWMIMAGYIPEPQKTQIEAHLGDFLDNASEAMRKIQQISRDEALGKWAAKEECLAEINKIEKSMIESIRSKHRSLCKPGKGNNDPIKKQNPSPLNSTSDNDPKNKQNPSPLDSKSDNDPIKEQNPSPLDSTSDNDPIKEENPSPLNSPSDNDLATEKNASRSDSISNTLSMTETVDDEEDVVTSVAESQRLDVELRFQGFTSKAGKEAKKNRKCLYEERQRLLASIDNASTKLRDLILQQPTENLNENNRKCFEEKKDLVIDRVQAYHKLRNDLIAVMDKKDIIRINDFSHFQYINNQIDTDETLILINSMCQDIITLEEKVEQSTTRLAELTAGDQPETETINHLNSEIEDFEQKIQELRNETELLLEKHQASHNRQHLSLRNFMLCIYIKDTLEQLDSIKRTVLDTEKEMWELIHPGMDTYQRDKEFIRQFNSMYYLGESTILNFPPNHSVSRDLNMKMDAPSNETITRHDRAYKYLQKHNRLRNIDVKRAMSKALDDMPLDDPNPSWTSRIQTVMHVGYFLTIMVSVSQMFNPEWWTAGI